MLGITIRKGAGHDDLYVEGKRFDLSDKKNIHVTCALVRQYLENKGWFKRSEVAGGGTGPY